jgi:uncharacterized protein DUF2277/metallo-beta-lactamase-like protein
VSQSDLSLKFTEIPADCAGDPKTVGDLMPLVFHRALDGHQMSFAFGELVAHLNYLKDKEPSSARSTAPVCDVFHSTNKPRKMCQNIKPLFNFDPPATADETRAASLQFVRKISGFITSRKRTKTPSPPRWSKLRKPPCAFFQHSKPAHRPGIEKHKRQRQKLAPLKDLASRALRSS